MASLVRKVIRTLFRKKLINEDEIGETQLARCLSTVDLTALGIGSTLGAGIYVVAGQVAKQTAGPAVILSFLIAAVASVLAGLCYAEFGARVPKTGSAYVYSYVTVGELWAFIIGWNLILEYVIGTASVARAWSTYFDSLINNTISTYFETHIKMNVPHLSPYPDFFALGITLVLTVILAVGVKESSMFNNIFTGVNLLVVLYVVICGLFKANFRNWNIPKEEVPVTINGTNYGEGGFFPFGVSGMLSGAATCFYAFVGFDAIATTGEEVRNPQKAIPISIIVSLFCCFVAYFGVAAIVTLIVPYFTLNTKAPLPWAFEAVGWSVAKYVIAIGAVCGLSTSLLGAMFPMPRVIYAMASDGLLFRFLANVSARFQTPVIATIVSGILAGVMAMLFDLKDLVDMMSIGTLLAYTLVAACVLILRYEVQDTSTLTDYGSVQASHPSRTPTEASATLVSTLVLFMGVLMVGLGLAIIHLGPFIGARKWWAILTLVLLILIIIVIFIIITRQPQNTSLVTFKVPLVPLVPCVSIFINLFLMLKLSVMTWVRFGIWMAIGFLIYFGYGIRHSSMGKKKDYEPFNNEDETSMGNQVDNKISNSENANLNGPR